MSLGRKHVVMSERCRYVGFLSFDFLHFLIQSFFPSQLRLSDPQKPELCHFTTKILLYDKYSLPPLNIERRREKIITSPSPTSQSNHYTRLYWLTSQLSNLYRLYSVHPFTHMCSYVCPILQLARCAPLSICWCVIISSFTSLAPIGELVLLQTVGNLDIYLTS